MPSSGYPIENFSEAEKSEEEVQNNYKVIEQNALHAIELGLFIEWLESFVGAYNYIKAHNEKTLYTAGQTANIASQAGIIEWDM